MKLHLTTSNPLYITIVLISDYATLELTLYPHKKNVDFGWGWTVVVRICPPLPRWCKCGAQLKSYQFRVEIKDIPNPFLLSHHIFSLRSYQGWGNVIAARCPFQTFLYSTFNAYGLSCRFGFVLNIFGQFALLRTFPNAKSYFVFICNCVTGLRLWDERLMHMGIKCHPNTTFTEIHASVFHWDKHISHDLYILS